MARKKQRAVPISTADDAMGDFLDDVRATRPVFYSLIVCACSLIEMEHSALVFRFNQAELVNEFATAAPWLSGIAQRHYGRGMGVRVEWIH